MSALSSVSADPFDFDKAMHALEEWDRKCRELHKAHIAEIRELQKAFEGED